MLHYSLIIINAQISKNIGREIKGGIRAALRSSEKNGRIIYDFLNNFLAHYSLIYEMMAQFFYPNLSLRLNLSLAYY